MADIEWSFDLVDNASDAAKKIDASMAKLPKTLSEVDAKLKKINDTSKLEKIAKTTDPLKKLELALKAQRDRLAEQEKSVKSTGVTLDSFGLGFAAKMATVHGAIELAVSGTKALVGFLANGAVSLAKFAIASSDSKRAMLGTLDVFEGSKQQEVFGVLQKMGIAVGQSADDAVKGYADMRAAGFKAKEAQDVLAASFDVAAQKGGGEAGNAAAAKFQDLFVKFRALEKVGKKDILSLARDVGIAPEVLADALGKRIKTTSEGAKKLLDAGTANAIDVSNALLDVVENKFDKGGALGDKAKEFAEGSIPSQLQRIKDKFGNLFEDSKLQPIVNILKKVADAIDGPLGEKAQKLSEKFFSLFENLESKFDDLRTGFDGVFDIEKLSDTWNKISGISDALGLGARTGDDWQRIGKMIGGVVMAVGGFVALLIEVGDLVSKLIDKFIILNEKIYKGVGGFLKSGWDSAKGFVSGLSAGSEEANAAAAKMGESSLQGLNSTLEIQSPSRKFFKSGAYSAEGYAGGFATYDLGASVRDSMNEIASYRPSFDSASASSAAMPYASGGGAVVSVNVGDINVNGAASPVETAREVSRSLSSEVIEALQRFSYA